MKKTKTLPVLFISIISTLVLAVILSFGISAALYNKYVNGNGTYGEVSLRSYYECGSGTEADPFVITRPRHLYNLSRLQGLGVYGEKKYFQLGKVDLGGVDSNGVPMCYVDDSSSEQKPYLDMSSSNQNTIPINAIGSEALPFYGEFDGQNCEIKNLNVYANPQDAGLFGYTAHNSVVQNLFLSNVTIHALGYTNDYADLYSPESTIGNNVWFVYDPNDNTELVDFPANYLNTVYSHFYANNLEDFEYTAEGSSHTPSISIHAPSNSYTFSTLLSGDLITTNEDNEIIPNLDRIFEFFKEKKDEQDAVFPIQASSSGSLIVSSVDRYGQKHSKVLITLEFDFTLDSASSTFISMGVHVGVDHGNNIGLVAGHADGSIVNCYVYNGAFDMNNGGEGYHNMENGSNLGLIGLVGGTVQNVLADEADIGVKDGKNIGVLDFTTVYRDIIDGTSFNGSASAVGLLGGVTYHPVQTSKYMQYLRSYNGNYITLEEDAVSFKGRSIITNTDLGVFTVATNSQTSGMDTDAGNILDQSVILTEDLTIDDASGDDNYYIYYATGEFNKSYNSTLGSTYSNYWDSYYKTDGDYLLSGQHFPNKDHVSRESFVNREARQNYFIRFKLDPGYRRSKGFYFSDLDTDTDGGAFLANYFNYKLVDQNGHHIPITDKKCGVMLKNNLRQEVSSLSASFACPDMANYIGQQAVPAYALEDEEGKKYVDNRVNFEIKNDLANVTVVAAPAELGKSSVLGVYKLDDGDFTGSIDYDYGNYRMEFTQSYSNPDYAFFMPNDNNLSYFDYRVNGLTNRGELGNYASDGTFTPATSASDATVVKEYGLSEFGYSSGKTRLFAHTFCLPKGRYCLGSASKSGNEQCVPKIYYLCAQGQDDGQFDFDDNVFAGTDRVENVDFTNVPRFNNDGTANIIIADITAYNPNGAEANKLGNRRCYVALANSDRSLFSDNTCNLSFAYDPVSGKFIVSSTTLSAITHVSLDNYCPTLTNGDQKELTVVLLGIESSATDKPIVYPPDNQEVFYEYF